MSELITFLVENKINFEENVLLKKRTWLKTGGFVKVWIEPSNGEELVRVAEYFYKESIQYQVIGHTSNIYFLDSTNIEVIVSTKNIKSFQQNNDVVLCDCGVSVSRLSRYFVDLGYAAYTLGSVFADLERKSTLSLKIYLKIIQMLTRLRIIRPKSFSELLLKFYGYDFLLPHVSKKTFNTFIWKPEIMDKKQMFNKYVEFMQKVFVDPKLKIEIC